MSEAPETLRQWAQQLTGWEEQLRLGGGDRAIERQHEKGRLTARERIAELCDPDAPLLEVGLWAGWEMYDEWGGAPAAGVVTASAASPGGAT